MSFDIVTELIFCLKLSKGDDSVLHANNFWQPDIQKYPKLCYTTKNYGSFKANHESNNEYNSPFFDTFYECYRRVIFELHK